MQQRLQFPKFSNNAREKTNWCVAQRNGSLFYPRREGNRLRPLISEENQIKLSSRRAGQVGLHSCLHILPRSLSQNTKRTPLHVGVSFSSLTASFFFLAMRLGVHDKKWENFYRIALTKFGKNFSLFCVRGDCAKSSVDLCVGVFFVGVFFHTSHSPATSSLVAVAAVGVEPLNHRQQLSPRVFRLLLLLLPPRSFALVLLRLAKG